MLFNNTSYHFKLALSCFCHWICRVFWWTGLFLFISYFVTYRSCLSFFIFLCGPFGHLLNKCQSNGYGARIVKRIWHPNVMNLIQYSQNVLSGCADSNRTEQSVYIDLWSRRSLHLTWLSSIFSIVFILTLRLTWFSL